LKGSGSVTITCRDGGTGFTNNVVCALTSSWQRFEISRTTAAASTQLAYIFSDASGNFDIWGAQLELGSYSTSYIPTTSASVTRNVDQVLKTGISSLIGQTEGTMFVDVNLKSRLDYNYIALAPNLNSATDYIGFYFTGAGIGFECVVGDVLQASANLVNSSTGIFKIAVAYKQNDFAMYVNGNLIGTDTSGSVPACSQFGFTAYNMVNAIGINSSALWKTRLTNEQLAELTSL
jgi:hypothetical protein